MRNPRNRDFAYIEGVLAKHPDSLSALRMAALAFFLGGEYERALDLYQRLVHREPDEPSNHYYLGRLYLGKGLQELGIEHLRRVAELDPQGKYAPRAARYLPSQGPATDDGTMMR